MTDETGHTARDSAAGSEVEIVRGQEGVPEVNGNATIRNGNFRGVGGTSQWRPYGLGGPIPLGDRAGKAISLSQSATLVQRLGQLLAALGVLSLTLAGCAGPVTGTSPRWRPLGLGGVLVHSLAVAPGRRGPLYAATDRGLYVHSIGGGWHPVIPNAELWQVATGDRGTQIFAADNSGAIHASRDGGRHWTSHLLTTAGAFAVSIRPGHGMWILAGAGNGIYLSRDDGRSWRRTARLPGSAADAFSWFGRGSRIVVAGTVAGRASGTAPPVLISRNAGWSWSPFGARLPAAGVMSIQSLPNGSILAGTMGHAVWGRRRGAPFWTRRSGSLPQADDHGAALVTIAGRSRSTFVGTLAYGVFRSRNGGGSWTPISAGLPQTSGSTIVLALAYDPRLNALLAGTPSGVFQLKL